MKKIVGHAIKCPNCGANKFKQEILETYYRYIDEKGRVSGYEDDFTHDIESGIIRCIECDADCNRLFDDIEIE